MKRIVVGVDDSPAAREALGWSARLAGRAGVEILAARVYTPTQSEIMARRQPEIRAIQLSELHNWCSDLPPGSAEPETFVVEGDPTEALLEAATAQDADLLVVGSRGAGGFLNLHLGSVAHHLVHHTTLPLAVVPRDAGTAIDQFVVGVDGSPASLAAVGLCAELAARLGVGVTAVHAYEPVLEWVPETDPTSWRRTADTHLRAWTKPISGAGIELEALVDHDRHPVAAIVRALEAGTSPVAVVGARGVGGFRGLRLGRIPLQLLHHTGRPVIVVPDPGA